MTVALERHWKTCLEKIRLSLADEQQFNTWIRPLSVNLQQNCLILYAPNQFVKDWVSERYINLIQRIVKDIMPDPIEVKLSIGAVEEKPAIVLYEQRQTNTTKNKGSDAFATSAEAEFFVSNLNSSFVFENYVEGKSNQLARAAAMQIGENPGTAYNPMFIYGDTGLGKTHLMQAIGNFILQKKPGARVLYISSERFVADMVRALQRNTINQFKKRYRSLDGLLIDDIQFFAGKDRSQEEFFHTFNSLIEGQQQIILTCDRYPKEINGLEDRLKSRFGWGLTVAIEPPELETRVAILLSKAEMMKASLPSEVAFFIAKRIRSNVRELEGALRRVLANAQFTKSEINLDFAKESLKDLLTLQDKLITIENIQKTVAEYYRIKLADLLSQRRSRSVARPRQMAMAIAKELTNHSLPEIGQAFGGRDHTTVLHACRKIEELKKAQADIIEDFANLIRTLTS